MNLTEQKKIFVDGLKQTSEALKAAGLGAEYQHSKETPATVDLSDFDFVKDGDELYIDENKYYLVDKNNIMLLFGDIDEADGEMTPVKDFAQFPRLTEVTILMGQNKFDEIEELFSDSSYFMKYMAESMAGIAKSFENGHLTDDELSEV